jgi:hypothetical protein
MRLRHAAGRLHHEAEETEAFLRQPVVCVTQRQLRACRASRN